MAVLRKDWVRFPGEDSALGSGKKIRIGGLIDGEDSDIRSKEYCGIVSAHQALVNRENWPISVQDEEKRIKNKTAYTEKRERELKTTDFISLDDRFWASLDGKAIMSLGEALDSSHGLAVNTFDFSESMSFGEEEPELEQEQELEQDPESDRIELQEAINEWIQERYGKEYGKEPEKEIQVFRAHPQIERKKISFNQLKHCLWAFKHKRPPQKRMLSCRRARRLHQRVHFNRIEP